MKKLLLLIIILFSVSYSFAQEEQLSEKEKARRKKNIQAGNPFKRFGYTPKIATLSKGKYLEFHDLDSIVRIGSFTYNVKRKALIGYTKLDTVHPESTLRPEIISRWFSPDPLSDEFPSWSPYNFTNCNPIRFIDPDGRAVEDIILLNKKNKEIGRIVIANHKDEYYKINTNYTPDKPLKINLSKIQKTIKDNVDAVSLNITYAGLVGGGMDMSLSITHFLNGTDKGNTVIFKNIAGGVGLDGEIALSASYSTFNRKAKNTFFNAEGMEGQFASQTLGGTIGKLSAGYSRTWGNQDNKRGELYPNHKSTTTWMTKEISTPLTKGGFRLGGRIVWGKTKLLKRFRF